MKLPNGNGAGRNRRTTGDGTNRRFQTAEQLVVSFGNPKISGGKQRSSPQSMSVANGFESIALFSPAHK